MTLPKPKVPIESDLTRDEKRALFDRYGALVEARRKLEAELTENQNARHLLAEEIHAHLGAGPFNWGGRMITAVRMGRGGRWTLKGFGDVAEEI